MKQKVRAIQVHAATPADQHAASMLIKQQGFSACTAHKISVCFSSQPARIDEISVKQDRTIELKIVVNCLVIAEGPFTLDAPVSLIQVLHHYVRVRSAFQRRRKKSLGGGFAFRRPRCTSTA